MINFSFNTPIIVGRLLDLVNDINNNGSKKILILTSKTINLIDEVQEFFVEMGKSKIISIHFIDPEAPLEKLENIVINTFIPDLIIAIGGGSVIDSAKAISLGWQNISLSEMLYKSKNLPASKIKVIAVPTTAGTGAELSFGAILTDKKNNFKGGIRSPLIVPDLVLIDKYLYNGASERLKAEVGFDCLAHAIETYVSKSSSPFVKHQSINCIHRIFSSLNHAVNGDIEAMETIAISSCMMGVNLSYSSTCLPHRMQYVLGPVTNSTHAKGLIVLYEGWLPMMEPQAIFSDLASHFKLKANQFIVKIKDLKVSLNIDYSLSDWNVDETMIQRMTEAVVGNVELDPCYESKDTIRNIFINSL